MKQSSHKHSSNPFHLPASLHPHYTPHSSLPLSEWSTTSEDLTDTPHDEFDTKNRSRLYIPPARFSSEEIHVHRRTKGGQIQKTKNNNKRSFKNNRHRHKMKSIKFVVPSRKNMDKQQQKEQKINKAVACLDTSQLAKILKENKLIKQQSNAPPSLMRSIAKSVF